MYNVDCVCRVFFFLNKSILYFRPEDVCLILVLIVMELHLSASHWLFTLYFLQLGCYIWRITATMRLKSGYKVEVMNISEVPISWHTAEVLSGNDHTYTVRYDSCSTFRSPSREVKIPRKFIRPCPPPVQSGENWVVGDLVEACLSIEECSWKVACVLKVLRGDHYLVRLLGCSQEFSIHRSQIRRRQYWQDGKWVLLPKVLFWPCLCNYESLWWLNS